MDIVINRRQLRSLAIASLGLIIGVILIRLFLIWLPMSLFLPLIQPKMGSATLEIKIPNHDPQNITVSLILPASLSAVLEAAAQHGLSYTTRDYGGKTGHVVESLFDVENSQASSRMWQFTINGQTTLGGIDDTIIQPWDVITWQYSGVTKN